MQIRVALSTCALRASRVRQWRGEMELEGGECGSHSAEIADRGHLDRTERAPYPSDIPGSTKTLRASSQNLLLFKTKVIMRLGHPCKTESYALQLRASRVRCLSPLSVMRSGISMCALDIRSVLSYFAWDILSSGNPTGPKVKSRSLSTCALRTSRIRITTAISDCRESG